MRSRLSHPARRPRIGSAPEALEPRAMLTGITGVGATLTVPAGQNYAGIVASFAVPGTGPAKTTYAARIDWGDGDVGLGFVSQPGGVGTPLVVGDVGSVLAEPEPGLPLPALAQRIPGYTYKTPGNDRIEVTLYQGGSNYIGGEVGGTAVATATGAATATVPAPPLVGTTVEGRTFVPLLGLGLGSLNVPSGAPASAYTVAIDWGDGSAPAFGRLAGGKFGVVTTGGATTVFGQFSVVGDHVYPAHGPHTVTVNVTGPGGLDAWTTSSIDDVIDYQGTTGYAVAARAEKPTGFAPLVSFTTPDPTIDGTPWVAAIDWGDGSPNTVGVITPTPTPGNPFAVTVSGSHAYAKPGSYIVSVDLVGNVPLLKTVPNGEESYYEPPFLVPEGGSGGYGATVATVA